MGPALLVLGDIPQKNGLSLSLLQRLEHDYQKLGAAATKSIATLSTNYRCHSAILELVGGLFYDSKLSWTSSEQLPVTHHRYKYPLVFICSDTNIDVTESSDYNMNEATAIVEAAIKVAKGCPTNWSKPIMPNLFIVSPCEEQVHKLNFLTL